MQFVKKNINKKKPNKNNKVFRWKSQTGRL